MGKTNDTSRLDHDTLGGADGELAGKDIDAVTGGSLPGKMTPPTITLKRGVVGSGGMW
jgi:hypothetical protein